MSGKIQNSNFALRQVAKEMKNLKRTAEVVIIGGGIMGVSTAYYLAKRGCGEVVILEKDLIAQASTGLSVGGIRQQFSNPANIRLSQESIRVYECFMEEFGVDINFRKKGYLFWLKKRALGRNFYQELKFKEVIVSLWKSIRLKI